MSWENFRTGVVVNNSRQLSQAVHIVTWKIATSPQLRRACDTTIICAHHVVRCADNCASNRKDQLSLYKQSGRTCS
jgi:hypothetical protein